MAVISIPNIALLVSVTYLSTPLEFACQVIDAELTLPGASAGTRIETACPDGAVVEAGSASNGQLTGNVFADPSDTGITWALATLYQARGEFPYSITWWADLDETQAMKFDGDAVVNSFKLGWAKPGKGKHPLDLGLVTAVMSRPVPVP